MAVTNRRQYEQGYPVTTTYYTPNMSKYSDSTNQGAQPSLSALAKRSSNYSASTSKTPVIPSSNYYGSGNSSGGSSSGGSGSSSKKYSSSSSSNYSSSKSTPGVDYDVLTGQPLSSSSGYDASGAYRKLLEAYQSRQGDYQSYLDQMNSAAQSAYDRGMSSLYDTYDNMMNLLSGSYDTQKNTLAENLERAKNSLLDTYNRSRTNVSSDAENSLKQAYISNMLAKRDIAQRLSSMGLNGGMTETTLAGMANQYGNRRNDINRTLNTNLANLEGTYNSNLSELEGNYSSSLADALAAYNNAVANANAQKLSQIIDLENALANNKMSAYANYQNMLNDYNQNYYNLVKQAIASGADISY